MKAIAIALSLLMLAFSFVCSVQCIAGGAEGGAAGSATGVDDNVKFSLHLTPHAVASCSAMPQISSFSDIASSWSQTGPGADIDVFFVVFDYDSILTVEYGMDWPADWGTGLFKLCPPALGWGGIDVPGTGVALTYADCQVSAAIGGRAPAFWTMCWTWLTPRSDGEIRLIPNPATHEADVVDCRPIQSRRKHYPVTMYNASVDVERQPNPACSVEPESLQFDPVGAGEGTEQQSFTITNIGDVQLVGTVSEVCHEFSIVSGGGSYSLAPRESKTVTMLFAPPRAGTKTCYVQTGTSCSPVVCRGVALPPPTCEVSPTELNFGVVPVGRHADLTLTITNIGSGTLEGVVSDTCSAYNIVGDSAYSLGYGESKQFTVRFSPTAPTVQSCKVKGTKCAEVACTGEGMHFFPVDPTGEAQPVVIQAGTIDGVALAKGDEIGIFDGSLCVGAAKFSGPYPFTMTAWMQVQLPDRDALPGAIPGHAMVFKTWQSAYSREWSAAANYAAGNGTFGEPATVVSSLQSLRPTR